MEVSICQGQRQCIFSIAIEQAIEAAGLCKHNGLCRGKHVQSVMIIYELIAHLLTLDNE